MNLAFIYFCLLSLLGRSLSFSPTGAVYCNKWMRTCANPLQALNPTGSSVNTLFQPVSGQVKVATRHQINLKDNTPSVVDNIQLGTLKTGMELNGVVVTSTPYAAFISAGVVRSSKGGNSVAVNAMLHKSDIDQSTLQMLRNQVNTRFRTGGPQPLLEKSTPVTVFVKEVFKQSGRFSVTTNPNIRKEDIIKGHERTREEGSQRRRTRRLRRQLESVAAGTLVTGYVDHIIPEGVLVKITSLGSLEVNGLIRKADLPEQFQVPPGMKESYQTQMLQQDFIPGRAITCGVTQVHPNPDDSLIYNVKLMFEDFDGPPLDDVELTDRFETMSQRERDAVLQNKQFTVTENDDRDNNKKYDDSDEDDTDFEDAFGDYEQEVRDLYDELIANSVDPTTATVTSPQHEKLLKVRDFYDWEAIQDMIKEKSITKNDVDDAIRNAGASKTGTLSLEQFEQVVGVLQEYANEREEDENEEEEEDDQEEEGEQMQSVDNMKEHDLADDWSEEDDESSFPSKATPASSSAARNANIKKSNLNDEDEFVESDLEDEEDSDSNMTAEEDFEMAVQEAFDELKSADGRVSVTRFKEWEDVKTMLEVGAIDMEALDAVIDHVLQQNTKSKKVDSMDMVQFKELLIGMDEIADLSSDDFEEQESEQRDDKGVATSSNSPSRISKGLHDAQDEEEEENDDDDEMMTEEDYEREAEEALQEMFEELKNTKGKVPVKSFLACEEIKELMEEGHLEESVLMSMLTDVGASMKGQLSYQQFSALMTNIDEQINGLDDDTEEPDEEEGNEETEEKQRVHQLTQSIDEREERHPKETSSYMNKEEEEEEELKDELSEKELDEMAKSVFRELVSKDNKKTISFKVFMQWPGILNEITTGTIQESEVMNILKSVDKMNRKELDFDQFLHVMDKIEEIITERGEQHDQMETSTIDDEEEEESGVSDWSASSQSADKGMKAKSKGFGSATTSSSVKDASKHAETEIQELTQEMYNNLKGKNKLLSVESFKSWDELQELLRGGDIKHSTIEKALIQIGAAATGSITITQFASLLDTIQNAVELASLDPALMQQKLREIEKNSIPDKKKNTRATQGSSPKTPPSVPSRAEEEDLLEDHAEEMDSVDYWEDLEGDSELQDDETEEYPEGTGEDAENLGDEEENTEEAAREIYDELRGSRSAVTLKEVMEWEDMKAVLESGALSKSDLTDVLSRAGVDVTGGDQSIVPFETFFSLILSLEDHIDYSKLGVTEDELALDERIAASERSSSSSNREQTKNDWDEEAEEEEGEEEETGVEDERDDKENDREVEEMFAELSKGKEYITIKTLRQWDELQGLVEAELISPAVLESYFTELHAPNGRVDLHAFRDFVSMLDTVLVDEEGAILGPDERHRAVDLA